MEVSKWSCDDVKAWLVSEGFAHCGSLLCDIHGVDGEVLLSLTEKVSSKLCEFSFPLALPHSLEILLLKRV